jgi:propionyl-CoA carboxylase alpha chain
MDHPRWRAGQLSTAFIAEEFPQGFAEREPDAAATRLLVAIASAIAIKQEERRRQISGRLPAKAAPFARRRVVHLGHHDYPIDVTTKDRQTIVVLLDEHGEPGRMLHVTSDWKPGDAVFRGAIDGKPVAARVDPVANGFALAHAGFEVTAFVRSPAEAEAARLMPEAAGASPDRAVHCPMPGLVVSIAVREGQPVKAGETLAVVEAMKMENVLRAEHDGTIGAIRVKPGDVLPVDAVILEFS